MLLALVRSVPYILAWLNQQLLSNCVGCEKVMDLSFIERRDLHNTESLAQQRALPGGQFVARRQQNRTLLGLLAEQIIRAGQLGPSRLIERVHHPADLSAGYL
ncbi:MAG: hypothetical protein ACK55I_18075, partial [bacterium]